MSTFRRGTHALAYQPARTEGEIRNLNRHVPDLATRPAHCGGRHQDGSACEEHLHAEVVA